MIHTDDHWKLAERHKTMRGDCKGRRAHVAMKPICSRCKGREYVPNVTETALMDVLFKASFFLDICYLGTDTKSKWSVEGTIINSDAIYGEGDTRHAALVATVLGLPEEETDE